MTPSFNQGGYIEETISSILDQGYDNLEYIIMDGGSTDQTVSVIERYSDRIAYWVSAKDAGQSDAIEQGLARATGDIFAWVNSDDALAPGALAAVAAAFEGGDADIVAGIVNIRENGRLVHHHRTGCRAGPLEIERLLDLRTEWMTGRFFYQPEVFFSRAIYERAGGKIDRGLHYSMDYDLWVRCARAGARIKPIDYELANFRVHADQKTSTVAAFLPELTRHAESFRAAIGLPALAPPPQEQKETRRLRVGMVNDFGFRYGAGRAHRRMAECLSAARYDIVLYKFLDDIGDETACRFDTAVDAMRAADVDVILLGNLHGAFPEGVDLAPMAALAPVLIVTHDFFHLTGRCPYPLGCDEYLFMCPATCPTREQYPVIPFDEIPHAHARKIANMGLANVHYLANSSYMRESARRLLAVKWPDVELEHKVRCISLPVPEAAFSPGDRAAARAAFELDAGDVMVLTASSSVTDRRKGFRHAVEACQLVGDARLRLFALGRVEPEHELDDVTYLGHLDDDEDLARCFRAADVFVSATADDTFGQVFVEAARCGCPSIGYRVGGVPEVCVPGETGWLVERNDIAGLADRLRELVRLDDESREAMRGRAHIHATSRWGAPSFLSGINEVFRALVGRDDVTIPTGIQYGGFLTLPIRSVHDPKIVFGAAFDPPEGPFLDDVIDCKLRWMTAPEATFDLLLPAAGVFLLTIGFGNVFVSQEVRLSRGGECVASFELAAEPWAVRRTASFALDLPAGETTLHLAAAGFLETPGRNLHLAVLGASLEPTDVADGFHGIERTGPALPCAEDPGLAAIQQDTTTPPGQAMQRDLLLRAGFDLVEGPYPHIGVPMRLAWLTAPIGRLFVASEPGQDSLCLDIHLPFRQEIFITAAGDRFVYAALDPSSWDRPTRLVLPLTDQAGGWHEIELECVHRYIDDAGRALHLAMLGAQPMVGPPETTTPRYGSPDTPLTMRAATSRSVIPEG